MFGAEGRQKMGLRTLPLSPSQNGLLPNTMFARNLSKQNLNRTYKFRVVSAKSEKEEPKKEEPKKEKQSLFGSITEALDFSQVRSAEDAQLLDEAREATKSGGQMSKEQYGALRRKIGGTYQDFFKSYVDGGSSIGVCYGLLGNNLPSPREVISMYKTQRIERMRLYDPNPSVLEALRGSNIQILVGVKNEDIEKLATSYAAAKNWVETNIRPFWPEVHFRYIAVGNEVIPGEYSKYVLPAMQNLHNALSIGGLWHNIKVSTSVSTSVMGMSYPPSAGTFGPGTSNYMIPIVLYLSSIGAPLLANVYPYFSYIEDTKDISLSYALFTSRAAVVMDGTLGYHNLFDAIIDALHAAMERAGAGRVPIVVSETGWPSAGNGNFATVQLAREFNSNVVRHVLSSRGTPRRPGKPIETYLFSMFNENEKPGEAVERHWGLFYPDLRPVYPIDFM